MTYLQVMILDLTDAETGALARLLSQTINSHRYLSPRVQTLRGILAKIRPEPAREPLPPEVNLPSRAVSRILATHFFANLHSRSE
jgi:hypothetical protein